VTEAGEKRRLLSVYDGRAGPSLSGISRWRAEASGQREH